MVAFGRDASWRLDAKHDQRGAEGNRPKASAMTAKLLTFPERLDERRYHFRGVTILWQRREEAMILRAKAKLEDRL
jgi:hypothetical protein